MHRSLLAALSTSLLLHLIGFVVRLPSDAALSARTGGAALLVRIVDAKVADGAPLASIAAEVNDATLMHRKSSASPLAATEGKGMSPVSEEKQRVKLVSENELAPLGAGLGYLPVEQVSIRPYPIDILEGVGPPDVDPGEMYGRSVLKVWINEIGEVVEADVLFSDMSESFLAATVGAFKRLRFMPGWLDGKPVGSVMTVEINAEDFALPAQY